MFAYGISCQPKGREYIMKKRPASWDAIVIKSNDLIRKSRYNLSLQEQKIVLFIISQISPYDEDFKEYTFSIIDFCNACGISLAGKNYQDLKKALLELSSKKIGWATLQDGRQTILSWFEKVYLNPDGTITLRLDSDLKPYLLNLRANFTSYELLFVLHFKSRYSIRLYEFIRSIHYHVLEEYTADFSVDELKGIMGAEHYNWQSFKQRALEPAVNEINRWSDKTVSWAPVYDERKIVRVEFTINTKHAIELMQMRDAIEKEMGYNPNQLSMWDGTAL